MVSVTKLSSYKVIKIPLTIFPMLQTHLLKKSIKELFTAQGEKQYKEGL